jgi:hypothetical protein
VDFDYASLFNGLAAMFNEPSHSGSITFRDPESRKKLRFEKQFSNLKPTIKAARKNPTPVSMGMDSKENMGASGIYDNNTDTISIARESPYPNVATHELIHHLVNSNKLPLTRDQNEQLAYTGTGDPARDDLYRHDLSDNQVQMFMDMLQHLGRRTMTPTTPSSNTSTATTSTTSTTMSPWSIFEDAEYLNGR